MSIKTYDIPLVAGLTPTPQQLLLDSQQQYIRGIVVDNGNSSVQVNVYQAAGAIGQPNVILPGWSRGFSVATRSSCWVTFTGAATQSGNVHIEVSDESQTAFSTQLKQSDIPQGAKSFFLTNTISPTLILPGVIGSVSFFPGQNIYVTNIVVTGAKRQPIVLVLGIANGGPNIYIFEGDLALSELIEIEPAGIFVSPAEFEIGPEERPIGVWNIEANITGYVL